MVSASLYLLPCFCCFLSARLSVCLCLHNFNLSLSYNCPLRYLRFPPVSSLLGAGKEASLSLLRNVHSSCALHSLPCFWEESLAFPPDNQEAGRGSLSVPTVRVAVPKLWKLTGRRSPALALRGLPGGGGRKGRRGRTQSGKEGKRRASLSALHHFQSKLRNKKDVWGARGTDPGAAEEAGQRAVGPPEQLGFVPPLPRRAEQGGCTRFSAREGRGVRLLLTGEGNSIRPPGSLGSEDQSCLLEMSFGTWTPLQLQIGMIRPD